MGWPTVRAATLGNPVAMLWQGFRDSLLTGGRVVDTDNGGISHTEGQGIALVCAALAGDAASFYSVYEWTVTHLRRDADNLFSWRYRPDAAVPVDDLNNATDGDLLIAYGLFLGARRWNDPGLANDAALLAADIERFLVVPSSASSLLLLPGADGFRFRSHVIVNPSYYIFPALEEIGRQTRMPVWGKLRDDGLRLLRAAQFGRWGLPPDWLRIGQQGVMSPDDDRPARFSWDAIRVPLYLCWGGRCGEPAVHRAQGFWRDTASAAPAWTDLQTDALSPYRQNAGIMSIRRLVDRAAGIRPAMVQPEMPSFSGGYYTAALSMLCAIADQSSST